MRAQSQREALCTVDGMVEDSPRFRKECRRAVVRDGARRWTARGLGVGSLASTPSASTRPTRSAVDGIVGQVSSEDGAV